MSNHTTKTSIFIFLFIYFAVGITARYSTPNGQAEDIYPFFSWFLFVEVPARVQSEHAIRFLELNSTPLSNPLFFREASGSLYDSMHPSAAEYHNIIQQLGSALNHNNESEVLRLRSRIEQELQVDQAVYEVVTVKFNPIEYWKDGEIIEVNSLSEFIYEK